jgi:hypothetical protein
MAITNILGSNGLLAKRTKKTTVMNVIEGGKTISIIPLIPDIA